MPHKDKKVHNSFSRDILAEVFSEKSLRYLDRVYSRAKLVKAIRKLIEIK